MIRAGTKPHKPSILGQPPADPDREAPAFPPLTSAPSPLSAYLNCYALTLTRMQENGVRSLDSQMKSSGILRIQ